MSTVWKTRLKFIGLLACLALLVACATTPISGRTALHLVPESSLVSMADDQYREVLTKEKLSTDRAQTVRLRRVGRGIADSAGRFLDENGMSDRKKSYNWEFNLIDKPDTINAWAMPGGKVAFYSGIMPLCRDETGVAVVMGHEAAHVLAGHGAERMSQQLLVALGAVGLAVALKDEPVMTQQIFLTVFGVGASLGYVLPYSRLHETEADQIGLKLMARAGYDPRAAVSFWTRMAEQGGDRPPEFLSTHPAPESRIAALKSYMPEAMKYYRPGRKTGRRGAGS